MPYQVDIPANPPEPSRPAPPSSPPPTRAYAPGGPDHSQPWRPPPTPPSSAMPSTPPPTAPPPSAPPPSSPPPTAEVGYEEKAHLAAIVGETERVWVQVKRSQFIDADATNGVQRGTKEIQLGLTVTPSDGPTEALRRTFDQLNTAATHFLSEMD